jgi:hypothetical protein
VTRHAWRALLAAAGAAVLLCGARTAAAVRSFAGAPALTEAVAAEGPRGFRAAAFHPALATLTAPGRAVVLVYAADCAACADNMWNWVDVVRAADPAVRFYAVGPSDRPAPPEYWAGLDRRVAVAAADRRAVHQALRVDATPSTLLVQDGVVERTYVGLLTPAARRSVLRFVGARPEVAGP